MKKRLVSLDVLRGADMFFIMGGSQLIVDLCVLLGFGGTCEVALQFRHVAWHGLHFEDMIFPLFLFIAGVSFPYSAAKQRELGSSRSAIVLRAARRMLALVALGSVYNGIFSNGLDIVWGSVLARIGLAWFGAAMLYLFLGLRVRVTVAAGILLGYWMLLRFAHAPDALDPSVLPDRLVPFATDAYSPLTVFAGWVDRTFLPGRLTVPGVISNQGVLSTFPAVVTAMLGMFTGEFIRSHGNMPGGCRCLLVSLSGLVLMTSGCLVAFGFGSYSMPFNKILWSSSFTLTVGGISALLFALFHYVVDVNGLARWTFFFRVIGMNAITIYMAKRIVDFVGIGKFFLGGVAAHVSPALGAVLVDFGGIVVAWIFLCFLYRKQVFLKV